MMDTPEIVVLGDSHIQYFGFGVRVGLYEPYTASTCLVSAATAAGLRNPDSFTAASKRFKEFLEGKPHDSVVILHLGEVDCGILIWLKAEKNGITPEEQSLESIEAYLNFADELREDGFFNVVITSATIPTINDLDHIGDVVTERRSKVSANFRQRTDLTLHFNRRLKEGALDRGIDFIDATGRFMEPNTRLCDPKFRNKVRRDHHMDNSRASVEWAAEIRKYMSKNYEPQGESVAWACTSETFIKALPRPSSELPAEMLYGVREGSVITGVRVSSARGTAHIDTLAVDGKFVVPELRFAWEKHFDAKRI